jgi:hypothetical protein
VSLPQFKELVAIDIEKQVYEYTCYLVEQGGADLSTLRGYQGRIAGLREALAIISDQYRKMYG